MGNYRLGLAGRIIAGLLAITFFSIAAVALAVFSVNRLSAGLEVSNQGFRSALKASDVVRQSGAVATILASVAPRLKEATNQAAREEETSQILPAVQALRRLLDDVGALRVDARASAEVRRDGAALIARIEALDGLVGARIEMNDANAKLAKRVLDAQSEIETLSDAIDKEAAGRGDKWRDAGYDLTGVLYQALGEKQPAELLAIDGRARRFVAALDAEAAKMTGGKTAEVAALTTNLAKFADAAEGAVAVRQRQLKAQEALDADQQARTDAGRAFEASVNRLIDRISADVDRSSAELADMVDRQRDYLILLAAAGLIGALGIAAYVNQGVVRRLTRLRDTMLDRVAGRPRAIDTAGDDEISDMAQALAHFVMTIEASERNLRIAREAADAANQAKSGFLAAMSHEIRTPMNGVTTMAELLIRTRLTDEQKSIAQVIVDSGVSLLAIINDILDFSKIEAGKIDLEWVDADIAAVAGGVGRLLEARATERGLSLNVDLDPALPALVRADPTRLRQILLNLVGNAIKFTESGSVTLSVAALSAPVEGQPVRLRFAITDTGIGLTPEQKDRLFKPFSQADGSITRRFGGTGLGLSICKRLTEMMDGVIDVDSEAGVGSTFHFTLPLMVVAIERSAAAAQASAGASETWKEWIAPSAADAVANGVRLLAADDNPTNRLVLAALFDRLGYVVDLVKDGEEAWVALQNAPYGLLLTDCHMPNLDGFALTRRLRAAEAAGERPGHLPVVALTADAISGAVDACLQAGMDGYVAKPINVGLLDQTIQRFLPASGEWRKPKTAADEPTAESAPQTPDAVDDALDLAVVEENFGSIGPDAREMLDMFLSSTAPLIDSLEQSMRDDDMDAGKDASHAARGAANMAGARRLGDLLAQIETALRAGDPQRAKLVLPAVRPAFVAVEAAVARLYDQVSVG